MHTRSVSLPKCLLLSFNLLLAVVAGSAQADLAQDFTNPPESAKPWTYWFWINGNISAEGIKADLQALAEAGVGGVLIMEVANPKTMAPLGPVAFASAQWHELFKLVVSEAAKHHMQVNMNNDAGWCGSGGPWIQPAESMQTLIATTTTVTGPSHFTGMLPKPKAKLGYYKDVRVLAYPKGTTAATTEHASIAAADVRDITRSMDKSGQLVWDAPAGTWEVIRIGCTTTGAKNKPAPESGTGLECDKFSAAAYNKLFREFIGKLCDETSGSVGSTFVSTHIDSWEVGTQDWTARMPDEFRKRRGYDLTPWLPLLASDDANMVIGSGEETKRFRWDFRRTCAELNDEYYAGAARKAANARGLQLSIEAYGGSHWLNPLTYGAQADVPMAEFWIKRWGAWHLQSPRLLASVSHVYGRPITGAESFTAGANADPFTEHPYSIKATGDWAMCEGINRFVFHRTALNPWPDVKPGMSFAGYGWHVDPAQPWWNSAGKAYFQYLARCQALLQQGSFVADVCRLVPDGEAYGERGTMEKIPGLFDKLPTGYNFDYISDRALLEELSVKDGRIIARNSKASYRILQLPNTRELRPEVMRKLRELVHAGATIAGPAPDHSPSLSGYPKCDEEVKSLAAELWGPEPNTAEHRSGSGSVVASSVMASALARACGGPDIGYTLDPALTPAALEPPSRGKASSGGGETTGTMPTDGLNWIHRRTVDGTDYYFLANPQYREVNTQCTFRVRSREAELWDPSTGAMRSVTNSRETDRGIEIPIHFDPAASTFVVFRNQVTPAAKATGGQAQSSQTTLVEIGGPWELQFKPSVGPAPHNMTIDKLFDWSTSPDEQVRYFSGNVTYTKTFDMPKIQNGTSSYTLSLGDVQIAADVTLNGKSLGVLWKPPFTIDVTNAIQSGTNQLSISVSNLWPNRLIGDEQFPDDCTTNSTWLTGRLPAWPEWFVQKQPRPEPRRVTFTTWKYYTKDSPLLPSGLIGPVRVSSNSSITR